MNRYESTFALAFHLEVTSRGCEVHDDVLDCEGRVEAAHLIPKQALRRRGFGPQIVWDPRNGIGACKRSHTRSDGALERFPAYVISAEAWQFARELGLEWQLEKLYGAQESDAVSSALAAADAHPHRSASAASENPASSLRGAA